MIRQAVTPDKLATSRTATEWRNEWFEIEDATYLNTAAHAAIPRIALRAVQTSIEANKFPHHVDDAVFFEVPSRIRESLSKMIGAKSEEIALTTGASSGVAAVAHLLRWHSGDEVITAKGEFPLQYATWKSMEICAKHADEYPADRCGGAHGRR